MNTSTTLDLDPKKLGLEEARTLQALRQVFLDTHKRISSLRLAALASLALQTTAGTRNTRENKLANALARGLVVREKLAIEEGGSYSSEETARLLGISKPAVLKRHQAGRLLAWRSERQGAFQFPVWQFEEGRPLAGFAEVLRALNEGDSLDDWGKVLFFLQPNAQLGGRRPLDFLRENKTGEVIPVAKSYAG
jgi:hypothetical protein